MDIEKEIKELFSNAEAHLLESREKFGEGYEDFILRNVKLEPGDKLLDVGCGVGQLVKLIPDNFNNVNVVGLDSSEKLIKKAREMTNLDFVVGDAYDIPYSNNSFDVVICQTLLIHVLEPQSVIEEMKRVAKNDGRVITIESLVHTDGSNQFVPNPGKEKLQKRLEAFKYEFEKKQEAGMI